MEMRYNIREGKSGERLVWFVDDMRLNMWVNFWDTRSEALQECNYRNVRNCPTCDGKTVIDETDNGWTPCPTCNHLLLPDDYDGIPF